MVVDVCYEVFEFVLVLVCAWAGEGFAEFVQVNDVLVSDLE